MLVCTFFIFWCLDFFRFYFGKELFQCFPPSQKSGCWAGLTSKRFISSFPPQDIHIFNPAQPQLILSVFQLFFVDWLQLLAIKSNFDESSLKWTIDSACRGPTPFSIALGEWGKRYSLLLARCYVTHYKGSSSLKSLISFEIRDYFYVFHYQIMLAIWSASWSSKRSF